MILKIDSKVSHTDMEKLLERLNKEYNLDVHISNGEEYTVLGLV